MLWLFSAPAFWSGRLVREVPNQTVQPTGASRLARRQIERRWRLAPVADFCVGLKTVDHETGCDSPGLGARGYGRLGGRAGTYGGGEDDFGPRPETRTSIH